MERDRLLAEITELGRVFARLGWRKHHETLRDYYRTVRSGADRTPSWNPQHLARLRQVVGLGPSPLPVAERCARCPPPTGDWWTGARTVMHLEDRYVSVCTSCGAEWVVRLTAKALKRG
jgi:hypothetical protein